MGDKMKKKLLYISIIISSITYSQLGQKTELYIEPTYEIISKDVKLNAGLKVDLKNTDGYYKGNLTIRKNDYIFKDFNFHYSKNTEVRVMIGAEFLKDYFVKPYFEINYYPAGSFKNEYETMLYRDFGIKVGTKIEKENHKADLNLYYIGNVLIIPENIMFDGKYQYENDKLISNNFIRLNNIFGEIITPGYSDYYKTPFIYEYKGENKKVGIQTKIKSNNQYKVYDNFSVEANLDSNHISRYDLTKDKTTDHTMLDTTLELGLNYLNKNVDIKNKISNEIILFYNNEKDKYELDSWSTDKQKSKNFFEYPNLEIGAKPIINKFELSTDVLGKLQFHDNLKFNVNLKNNYKLYYVKEYNKNKKYLKHNFSIIPEINLEYNFNENLKIKNEFSIPINLTVDYVKNLNKNITIKEKLSLEYGW